MRNLIIAFALMFSAVSVGQMSFGITDLKLNEPMSSAPNLGWYMTDDIMVSFGMTDWDNFSVSARYYTGFCGNMFVQAGTDAVGNEDDGSEYQIGASIGWSKDLGIWKLQFEPMLVLDDIQDFNPHLAWALRFNL